MRIAFYTLGCKTNQFETQALEQMARSSGMEIVEFSEAAEIYVVNTCTVTSEADRKSRAAVRRAKERCPTAVLGVCGCYSQLSAERIRSLLPVDVISGNRDHAGFFRELLEKAQSPGCSRSLPESGEPLPAGGLEGRTRAMLKIEDGCDRNCSYCIIPLARGGVRSLSPETVLAETTRLREEGFREIVLTGIEISAYGKDIPKGPRLVRLVNDVCRTVPDVRIRLGSLEPGIVTQAFCETLSLCRNLCPHFHLSLQSGSDSVLRRMRRSYTTARYLEASAMLRARFPLCNITTDIICGFPGESEREHAETLAFIRLIGFGRVHVFPFSPRKGTAAAEMENPVSREEKRRRCKEISECARTSAAQYMESLVGTSHQVLFETPFTGYTMNYVHVHTREEFVPGSTAEILLVSSEKDSMLGMLP